MVPFRKVNLPHVPGKLFLHHLPGMRGEPVDEFLLAMRRIGVSQIVCLPPGDEIAALAPDYSTAIREGTVPAQVHMLSIDDGCAPADEEEYLAVVHQVAKALRAGRAIVVHCRGGIGRTGTFAVDVLVALGEDLDTALEAVADAGSQPETETQMQWLARRRPSPD